MSTGKWRTPGVPHTGWSCVGAEDLGEPAEVCEMCEAIKIRYAHEMEHPDYPDLLRVGCICAEHMEQDTVAPRERERALRNTAARRRAWLSRQGWRRSRRGNWWIVVENFHISVFPRGDGWSISIQDLHYEDQVTYSRRNYPTEHQALLKAFDALVWASARREKYRKASARAFFDTIPRGEQ